LPSFFRSQTTISRNGSEHNHFFLTVNPTFKLIMIATVCISGSILSPFVLLLSSSNIAYGQTPEQALSSPSPFSPSISSNQTTAQQQGEQPQAPAPSSSGIPGLLFPPEQQPLQSQQLRPKPEQPPALAPITQTTGSGTIDSLIFTPGTRWIATGNWTLVLRSGNVNSFNTKFL
jgi:hypothetical protein